MEHTNFIQTSSWLPQSGTRARTVTLKKLKRNLESRGLTTHEVYTGLLQLITSPRVLVERWRAHGGLSNQKSHSTSIKSEVLSSAEKVERDEIRVEDTAGAEILHVKNVEVLSCPARPKTPELMDERVGGESRSFLKTTRKSISLNLHAYEAQCINANHKKRKSSTEISAADSSVSDEKHSTFHPALDRKEDAPIPKKLTIIEDFTCLEGTLLRNKILLDSSRVNQAEQPKTHVGCEDREETSKNPIPVEVPSRRKRPARKIYCCQKKSRIRRTFRQLFGKISTSSELDEEDDIFERFLGISRRKKSRNSSDSGVGLIETNSENTYVSDSEQHKSSEESTQSSSDEMEIDFVDEEKNEPAKASRSMPLLDSLASTSNSIEEMLADNLPDSSTSSLGGSPLQANSFSPEASNTKKKLTILVSPLDINSSDAFSPLTIEIDVPNETETSVPTSTTANLSQILTIPKIGGNEKIRENDNLPKYIDISDGEECRAVPVSPQNSKNAGIVIDTLANNLPNEKLSAGTARGAQDLSSRENEEISLSKLLENLVPVPEPEKASGDRGFPMNSTRGPTTSKNEGPNINEIMTQPALSSSPSVPRIRVLRPSELGSRWCPTPLNIPSSSENVPSVPGVNASLSAPSISLNHQPQAYGIPNVQIWQGNGITTVQTSQSNEITNVQSAGPILVSRILQSNEVPNVQPSQVDGIPNVQGESPVLLNHQMRYNGMLNIQPSRGNRTPNGQRASPVSLNHQLQGNGMPTARSPQGHGLPNCHAGQTFQNPCCTLVNINGERFPGTYNPNHVKAPNPPTYFQLGCAVRNPSLQGQDYERKEIIYKSVTLIFSYFCFLNTCLQQNESVYDPAIAKPLHNKYKAGWALLNYELINLRSLTGVPDRETLLGHLIKIYQTDFYSWPRISTQQFLTIFYTESLRNTLPPMPIVTNYQSTMYADQFPSLLRPPSPAYPPCSSPCCVPRSNVFSMSQNAPSRLLPSLNPHERAFSVITLPPNTPALSPEQLNRLREQIISYNKFRVEKPEKSRRPKKSPTKRTRAALKPVTKVAPIPTLVDPILRDSPPAQNIQSPIRTPPDQELGNIPGPENQMYDAPSSEKGEVEKRWSERFEDPLELMAEFPEPGTDNSKPDNNNNSNNNNNEQQITKMTTPTCSPTPETSIISESTHPVQEKTTHPVERETTYPVEQEPMCLVQERTTYPVSDQTERLVKKNSTDPVEREATCCVEEETTCPVERATACSVEGTTTCLIKDEATFVVEEETPCPIKEETTRLVEEEEPTYPAEEEKPLVGEATTSLVEEKTNYPLKGEMSHSNNTEESDDVSSGSACETIDVFDDSENMEEEMRTDKVSVIVLNDSTNENTEIPNDEDTETNFSILEVKSITKDIFDKLDTSKEELSTPKPPEARTDDIETHDDSSINFGLRNCLRCGEPSSVVCERCYEAFYCSSKCHEADWTEQHYLTCKPVPAEALALFEMSWNSQIDLPSLEDKLSTK